MSIRSTMERVLMTPTLAQKYLDTAADAPVESRNFRKLDRKRVERLAASIKADGWRDDGNPIRLDSKGFPIDGQHRLSAIVELGITVSIWLCRNVDQQTIDTGRTRTAGDMFLGREVPHAHMVAAVSSLMMAHDNGGLATFRGARRPTLAEHEATFEKYGDLISEACKFVRGGKPGVTSHLAFIHVLANLHKLPNLADQFIREIVESYSYNTTRNEAVLTFRNRMFADLSAKAKLKPENKLELLILTWNKFATGKGNAVKLNPTSKWPEIRFPEKDANTLYAELSKKKAA